MDIRFQTGGPSTWKADAVIIFVFKGEGAEQVCPSLLETAPWLGIAPAWRDFQAKKGDLTVMYGPPAMDVSRVLAVGLGTLETLTLVGLRHAVGNALRLCRAQGFETLGVDVTSLTRVAAAFKPELKADTDSLVREVVLSALLGLYRYDRWLTDRKDIKPDPKWLALLTCEAHISDTMQQAARLGEAEANGLAFARDLANSPANVVTPTAFAHAAEEVADKYDMICRVLGPMELEAEGMGAFMAVAQGAKQEARLVVMEYIPKGTEEQKPVLLVGKGITFDSGGISLKPSTGMHEMKGDMSGAAAVLGIFETLGQLAPFRTPSRPVIGLMPCTENMPSGEAIHPGDIVIAKNGLSVEIINTDAEGRLVLADAMVYAQAHWDPVWMIDIATLTGACVVALGKDAAGLFCTDDVLAASLLEAGDRLGERSWRMPLWEDTSKEALKSNVADMSNVGPREGGAIHAAVFLKQFVKEGVVWAHMDIAATDQTESPINAKGASGFGLRTLLETLW